MTYLGRVWVEACFLDGHFRKLFVHSWVLEQEKTEGRNQISDHLSYRPGEWGTDVLIVLSPKAEELLSPDQQRLLSPNMSDLPFDHINMKHFYFYLLLSRKASVATNTSKKKYHFMCISFEFCLFGKMCSSISQIRQKSSQI